MNVAEHKSGWSLTHQSCNLVCVLGKNSVAEPISLQFYNWFDFRCSFSNLVAIPKLKNLVYPTIILIPPSQAWCNTSHFLAE